MRVFTYIVSTALLAGLAAAQTAPASQTVTTNPPQVKKTASKTAKSVTKSPFAPKARISPATASAKNQNVKPVQAQTGNPSKASQSQAVKSKQAPALQAKAHPKAASPAGGKKQEPEKEAAKKQPAKKEVVKKQVLKKPEAKAAPVQAKVESKPAEPEKNAMPVPVAQSEPAKLPSPGKRDPFLSPLVAAGARGPSNCTTGKRCLVVDQIVLKGVVQMRNGNLALVENAGKRPYVLHENDSLFNGSVVKITGDSLILREVSNDVLGRPVTREVVKKVTAPSV
jgi:hypothetical protein